MTKGEFSKGVTIRLITAVVFGVIGSFAIYYALQMVAIFGEGMGVDARSKEIYANSHMIVHLFGAACSLAIGVFILNRSRFLTFLAIVALLTCGGYGILNMVGFTSTNRVSVAAAKDAGNAASEREYKSARADLEKQIDWASKTAAQEEGREKRRLLAYIDARRKELSALKAPRPSAENVLSDAQASTLAELTNTNARTWLLALPIPLAVLLFFAESFSFVVVGHMLSGAVALIAGYRAVSAASGTGNSGSGGGSGDRNIPKPHMVANKEYSEQEATMKRAPGNILPYLPNRKLSKTEAEGDLHSVKDALGYQPTQEFLGERWRRKQSTVCKWLKDWEADKARAAERVVRFNRKVPGYGVGLMSHANG